MTIDLLIIILSLILSAFFSGMEIAYVSSNKIHIEIEKKQGGFYQITNQNHSKTVQVYSNHAHRKQYCSCDLWVLYGGYAGRLVCSAIYRLLTYLLITCLTN